MIKPIGMGEALQRALMGLGDIGTAIQDNRKTVADVANTNANTATIDAARPGVAADAGVKKLAFGASMKQRQLLDALGGESKPAGPPAPVPGQADLGMGQADTGPAPGLGRPAAGMPDDHANLIAQLQRENGQFDATPDLVKAKHAAALTTTQNAGTLSNQGVVAGQQGIDTGAVDLATKRATQGATIANDNLAPTKTRAGIGLIGAQTNEANAKAAKDQADAAAGGDVKTIAATERQAKERFDKAGKETGFDTVKDNWANIQSAVQQANDPKAKDKVAADYTLLDQYMKMVNPGMGVRASNMEMFSNAMGLSDKIKSGMLKVQQGGKFDPDVRAAVLSMAQGIYSNHEKSYLEKLNSIDEGLSATPGASRERVFGKTMAARISGAGQPTGGLGQDDLDLINKYKPKAANAGQ